jgi:enamine deaminase RidA (YjgF/YER057c/UK114 family)
VTIEHLQPEGLPSTAYSQVVIGRGGRLVFVSGQVSVDENGQAVARGDLAGQARQAHANLELALKGAGASLADVTKLTTYVVGFEPEMLSLIREVRAALFGPVESPASTLVGVQALAAPEFLIEVEAYAVLD